MHTAESFLREYVDLSVSGELTCDSKAERRRDKLTLAAWLLVSHVFG